MFGKEVETAAQDHAMEQWPKESCGVVVGGKYIPVDNIAANPLENFQMPDDILVTYEIQAIIHSHNSMSEPGPDGRHRPHHPHYPTAEDMASQIETDVPWAIVSTDGASASSLLWWGDHVLDEPLIGRQFVPGVTDCYALIRGYYWQTQNIYLPEFPRDSEWWGLGKNLFEDGFVMAGFKKIDASEVRDGDVVLMNLGTPVTCHGAIVLGSLILHHLENRLSRREPLGPWRKRVTHWLRYAP